MLLSSRRSHHRSLPPRRQRTPFLSPSPSPSPTVRRLSARLARAPLCRAARPSAQSEVSPTSRTCVRFLRLQATFWRRVHSRRSLLGGFRASFSRDAGVTSPDLRPCNVKCEVCALDARSFELISVQSSLSSDRPNRVLRSAGRRGFKVASDAHFLSRVDPTRRS
jgi:hypothetical protein